MASAITLQHIRAFLALVEHRSFRDAAATLDVSQPAAIGQIGALEEICGVRLFQRQRENNRLTDVGVALLPSFRAVLSHLREAEFILMTHSASQTGELNVAAVNPVRVSNIMRELRVIYPNIRVNVIFAASDRVQNLVDNERVDAAFFVQRQKQPGQQAFHFYRYELMALLPLGHALTRRDALVMADFVGHDVVVREQGSLTRKLFLDALANAGLVPRIAYELGSRESVREAVAQGLGISVVAEDEHVPHECIVTRRIVSDDLKANSSLVVPNKQLGSPLIRTLIELVKQHVQPQAQA